jgi:hypothetical protein
VLDVEHIQAISAIFSETHCSFLSILLSPFIFVGRFLNVRYD